MARSNEPLVWAPFSAGMMVDALLVPALIVVTGILIPLGVYPGPDRLQALVNHPVTRLFLFVVISLSFFHWAHRFRFTLVDIGLKAAGTAIAVLCYGAAVAGTVVAGLVALHVL